MSPAPTGTAGDPGWSRLPHPGADRGGPVDLAVAHRILVVRADNIGDVVSTEPMLRAVRAAAPRARLDLLTSPVGALVAPMIDAVDGVLAASPSWQRLGGRADPGDEIALLDRLRDGHHDVLLVCTSASQSPWPACHLGLLAGIGTRIVHSGEFGGAVATHWVSPPPVTTHVVDRPLHLLAGVGVPDRGRTPRLHLPPGAVNAASAPAGPFAVLAPGASCAARRYPPALFGAAAAELAADGLPVLVAGSTGEQDLVEQVVDAAAHPGVTAAPVLALPVFTALLARAAVAITNNSGGMHLAAAVGTPVAVAFAGTERITDLTPRGVPSALLTRPVACSPCRQLRCPYTHQCLDVAPAEIAAAARDLAGRTRPDPPAHHAPEEERWPDRRPHPVPTA